MSTGEEKVATQVRITYLANKCYLYSSVSTSIFQNISNRRIDTMAPNTQRLPIPYAHHMTDRLL